MSDRRQTILEAALPIFVAKGYSGTTIADIRKASGATTGSIYHFFDGKPGLAFALWQMANGAWMAHIEALRNSRDPKEMVVTTVRGLLEWATENRLLFLFFEDLRIRAHSDCELTSILDEIETTHQESAKVYADWAELGEVADIPWPLASALIVGPAYDYLRKCASIEDHGPAVEMLTQHAWEAVCT